MRILRAILFAAALCCACGAGCKSEPSPWREYTPPQTNHIQATDFNGEVYVWEDFIFSTNRVQKGK